MKFECPHCKKEILTNNSGNETKNGDIVIRSRLVFLNSDGNILCRCLNCKKVVGLPLTFTSSEAKIAQK